MDIAAARAFVHTETRARLGDKVTISPFVTGEFGRIADPDRAALTGLAARYDVDPGFANLGNEKAGPATQKVVKRMATVSVPRAALGWLPVNGDLVTVTSRPDEPSGRIVAVLTDLPELVLLQLSAEA